MEQAGRAIWEPGREGKEGKKTPKTASLLWDFPPPPAALAWDEILPLKRGHKCGSGHGWGHNSRAHVFHEPGQMVQVA